MLSIPSTNQAAAGDEEMLLHEIPGVVPNLRDPIPGCAFADRCHMAEPRCREAYPPLEERRPGHWTACWRAGELMDRPLAESADG
jgi:peptide/nickel transport system ATP-binding protein